MIFRAEVDVFGTAAYPGTPQVEIPFNPRSIVVINMDSAIDDDAFVSFDGSEDHGRLRGGVGITYRSPVTKVWLRRGAAGLSPTTVQVIAEG